jgi:hypothetical protein
MIRLALMLSRRRPDGSSGIRVLDIGAAGSEPIGAILDHTGRNRPAGGLELWPG